MKNPFFDFFKPCFDYIDTGKIFRKPYSWLYVLIAALNLLFPLFVFYQAVSAHIFSAPAKFVVAFLLVFIVLCAAGWFSFQLWWNRKDKVEALTRDNDEFVAVPVISHLIQTGGEWLGSYIAIVGCLASLFSVIFLGSEASMLANQLEGINFLSFTAAGIVLMPLYGFIIIGVSRLFAELIRAMAAIANNTKK